MSAQPSTAQPTTPAISLATLREIMAELKAHEPERGCRWDRAATIVALRRVQPGTAAGWWVESECEPNRWYWVLQVPSGNWTCMCADYKQRDGPCKHALAVRLLRACEDREAAREATAPIPFPQRAYTDSDRFELTPKGLAAIAKPEPEPDPDLPAVEAGAPWQQVTVPVVLDGTCPTCGALGRVVHGGRRARCEYCVS